ncbi:MAG TPA: DUF3592 domain-containing protein [Gemmataceae bacterium]|jgi:hypothetical protein|nr:DUF3592 domain-containing protein [Gemmataceae bacterium]
MNPPRLPCPPPRDVRVLPGLRFVGWGALVLSAMLVFVLAARAAFGAVESQEYQDHRQEATGTVTGMHSYEVLAKRGKRTVHEGTFRFADAGGTARTFTTIAPTKLEVGSSIPIVYRADKPDDNPQIFDDGDLQSELHRSWMTPLRSIGFVILLAIFLVWRVRREVRFARSAQAIIGEVTAITPIAGKKGPRRWDISYRFGSPIIGVRSGKASALLKPALEVGSPVAVLYDRQRKRRHRLVLSLGFVDPESLHLPQHDQPNLNS